MTTIDFDSCASSNLFPRHLDLGVLSEVRRPALPAAPAERIDRAATVWGAAITLMASTLTAGLVSLAFALALSDHAGLAVLTVAAGIGAASILGVALAKGPGRTG